MWARLPPELWHKFLVVRGELRGTICGAGDFFDTADREMQEFEPDESGTCTLCRYYWRQFRKKKEGKP